MTTRIVRCASLIPIVAASALLLGGCGSDSSDTSSTSASATASATATTAAPTTTGTAAASAVGKQQAEQIAVATVPGGTVVNSEEQQRDGKTVWHVHIRDAKGWDYDVNVDAATGAVVPDSQNRETTATPAPPAGGAVTQEQAEQIAVATVPGGTVANAEQQQRDGKAVWHIHIRDAKGWDYDVNVDASTGAVLPDN
ncbi:PepSY domain-containing protein [Rhodococcus sp. JS3073]|uniref:PepSY domain-containing protein n=1 Tax=Rhodococcus sp. JS3073 TaxID=3002901 RepID=UPI002285B00F|nr:PepSY domain-containing protein [Rhodococcus sp. JS3073]WAM17446.1 PepSY domain-containing protein [Rhodococcus sp. JS3073]